MNDGNFSLFIPDHKVRIDLLDVPGEETKLRDLLRTELSLVAKSNALEF